MVEKTVGKGQGEHAQQLTVRTPGTPHTEPTPPVDVLSVPCVASLFLEVTQPRSSEGARNRGLRERSKGPRKLAELMTKAFLAQQVTVF